METIPKCPQCGSEYTYEDGVMIVCPECAHEFTLTSLEERNEVISDAHGSVLQEGDSVSIVKDLKVKGASAPIKQGTKVKNIRLVYDSTDGHNIECRMDGLGIMKLKSAFVKKI